MTPAKYGLSGWAEDCIFTGTEIHLDWRDRLMVLVGRPLHADISVECEHAPGRTAGSSRVWTERFIFPWTKTGGYADEAHSVKEEPILTLREALFIFWVLLRAVWWQVLRKVTGRDPEWMP